MEIQSNIVVTGAAGFIASCLVAGLNEAGYNNLILVDDFSRDDKLPNLEGKAYNTQIDREAFLDWFEQNASEVDFVFHLGARTDTTEKDQAIFDHLNLNYSKRVWNVCASANIPLVYASSAATYGDGNLGYSDAHSGIDALKPLNPYGQSKQDFDVWALQQETAPPSWAGLKFFNVYGPNEYHKGRMASVILHTFRQIGKTGAMKLFRSHRPDYKDGHQKRDFIYVKDVVSVMLFLMEEGAPAGLYNLGTGKARTFLDLASNTFKSLNLKPAISFIDTPEDIRDTYQYFTEADMDKLVSAGYSQGFHSLEDGIADYVGNYLKKKQYW
ncbi:MAG: ADP-glyceromanno-heptose 6-epimerase [Bacteroidetes bacterium]|nr:ADP-glyceromanno-heptose 6-epimerase [Bacteroidota bacterium]